MSVKKWTMVERTAWTMKCDECGQTKEWVENPPKAVRCACAKWHEPQRQTFTSKEYEAIKRNGLP